LELFAVSAGVTAVLAALPEEVAPLRHRLRGVQKLRALPCAALAAQLGAAPVVVAVTGMGEHNARRGLSALLSRVPVQRLLVLGVSGALSPDLRRGTLLVGERVMSEAGEVHQADPALVRLAQEAAGARPALLVSARELADTPHAKRRLGQLPGVAPTQAAVDLESATFAALAAAAGVPWLALRSISDGADESLPSLLNRCLQRDGDIRRGAVALGLLAEPKAVSALLTLRRRVRRSARALGHAVEAILRRVAAPTVATDKELI
jgi:nucleoside phosphorylase